MRISPTANASSKLKIFARINAHIGMNRYCDKKPIATAFGFRVASRKSFNVVVDPSPKPITNMQSNDRYVNKGVPIVNHSNPRTMIG